MWFISRGSAYICTMVVGNHIQHFIKSNSIYVLPIVGKNVVIVLIAIDRDVAAKCLMNDS